MCINSIERFVIPPDMPIIEAMSVIDRACKGIAFICEEGRLVGTLSDGDIRRHIIHGGALSAPCLQAANRHFTSLPLSLAQSAKERLKSSRLKALPILDEEGKLVSICFDSGQIGKSPDQLHASVVIMAGGKGTRLYPYTKVLPKALIPVGDVPITMHIMQRFAGFGCDRFTLIVNHQKNLIKAYFADTQTPFQVLYADEETPLGTGGGLSLLRGQIDGTFFLSNCDILIDADYADILRYHQKQENIATLVCATKKVTIPYGTIDMGEDGRMSGIREKPSFSFLTNTGLYVLQPEILRYIPDGVFINLTDVLQDCAQKGEKVGVYPISEEQWLDMGQPEEMERMERSLQKKQVAENG